MLTENIKIDWPNFSLDRKKSQIVPIFLPFMGCHNSGKCIFCAQDLQTGQKNELELEAILTQASDIILMRNKHKLQKAELAFFGGTFTALRDDAWHKCIEFAEHNIKQGNICGFRCSTRPDSLEKYRMNDLVTSGCHCVELGVQSFSDKALSTSCRGYSGNTAKTACSIVKKYGFKLVVQLMPGMPGLNHELFLNDVQTAIDCGADMLRFYPCLVLEGTRLATMWRGGCYKPWEIEDTILALSIAWKMAQAANVPVIRIGLAPEKNLEKAILAGPSHPALGARVLARALLDRVLATMQANDIIKLESLDVPKACQGFFWGNSRELAPFWNKIGIKYPNFNAKNHINLIYLKENKHGK